MTLDLAGLLAACVRRRWLAAGVFLAATAAAGGLAMFLPDVYRATATVLVERDRVAEALVRPAVTDDPETRLQTISQEILSRARLAELLLRLDPYPALRAGGVPQEVVIERLRRDIRLELKGVDATSGRGTTIAFALGFRGKDPRTVASVANALAASYVEENTRVRERQASGAADFLRAQVDQARSRLEDEEGRLGAFKANYGGELPEQVAANLATLERLNAQLHLNSEKQAGALARRETVANLLGSVDPASAGPEAVARRLGFLRQKLAELKTQYRDRHPEVVRVRAEIAALASGLDASGATASEAGPEGDAGAAPATEFPGAGRLAATIAGLDAQLRSLAHEEETLRRTLDAYQARVEQAPRREQELKELSREYEGAREVYLSLTKRYQEAQLNDSMEQRQQGERFRVLDAAIMPVQPAAPDRLRLLVLGAGLALAAAAAAVMLAERCDTSFHSAGDLRSFARIPVIAVIPCLAGRREGARRGVWVAACSAAGLAAIVGVSYVVARQSEPLVMWLAGAGL